MPEPASLAADPDLAAVAETMRGFAAPWAIGGGWAIDLYLGRVTRPHADVDVALFRADQDALRRHLTGWELRKAVDGRLVDWPADERLSLPVHEIHARRVDGAPRTLELLLNERDGDDWVYRRHASVRCPARRVMSTADAGLPILCPAVVLLYKAKSPRAVDEADFDAAHGALEPRHRHWLRGALETAHPGHPWIARLASSG